VQVDDPRFRIKAHNRTFVIDIGRRSHPEPDLQHEMDRFAEQYGMKPSFPRSDVAGYGPVCILRKHPQAAPSQGVTDEKARMFCNHFGAELEYLMLEPAQVSAALSAT